LADGLFILPLPFEPQPIDVYTRQVFPSHSVIDCAPDDNLIVALRGHFVDLMRCSTTQLDHGLQVAIDRAKDALHLTLVGDGVEVYDRSNNTHLRLLFSMPGDPSLMLHGTSVPTAALRDGVTVKLPKILQQPFDLWLPLIYRRVWMVKL
jgi:hypothetical protein